MKKNAQKGMPVWLFLVLCLLVVLAAGAYTAYSLYKEKYAGASTAYSRSQIRQLEEGSLDYKIATLFYSEEEIAAIQANTVTASSTTEEETETTEPDVEIVPVYGSTYEGYLMIVRNPEDISVAVNPYLSTGGSAPELETYVEMYKAAGGINAGGFQDDGGQGDGSIPQGMVIHNGELLYGDLDTYMDMIGIDSNNKLVTTQCTPREALEWGIQEAVTFGPTLINNYKVVYESGTSSLAMLNPRTAIGQRGDGTFLLLVVDGRGPTSFGATYEDIIKIFQDNDACMAANLDGGNSTCMMWKGSYVNTPVSMYGSRSLPTVFLVQAEED